MTHHVPVFEGDGASPEAVRATCDVLDRLDADLDLQVQDVTPYEAALCEWTVPDAVADPIDRADAVLFGAASEVHLPILYYLRFEYGGGMYGSVRPLRYLPGSASPLAAPADLDCILVRETRQGLYFAGEGDLADLQAAMPDLVGQRHGTPITAFGDGTFAARVVTDEDVRDLAEFTCDLAAASDYDLPVRLTCATKANVLTETDGLFRDVVLDVAEGRSGVAVEHQHVDDVGHRLLTDPERYDVILTPYFAGDLLSGVGAGAAGGLGVAPSGCYGAGAAYFEPNHGTAPDVAGEGVVNPTATMLSAAMLLEYLDEDGAATRLRDAISAVYAAGEPLTPDQGGTASTDEVASAVADRL